MRTVDVVYQDPLDAIWIGTAAKLGIEIRRDAEVFATWDGERVLTIGSPETLDADDSLAQMIFHELCHALVEGPESIAKEDWGLASLNKTREHACLRLQARLADQHGLRRFLSATTDFRTYYDKLPLDPLADDGDPAVGLAVAGWQNLQHGRWAEPIDQALRATAEIARLLKPFAAGDSLWSHAD